MSGPSSDPSDVAPGFAVEVLPAAEDARSTVVVRGELDITGIDELRERVREALRAGPVLADLSALTFVDSSGVQALDSLRRDSAEHGWDFRIAPALDENVRVVLDLTGMLALLPFAGSGQAG